jgi:hypothetical protein
VRNELFTVPLARTNFGFYKNPLNRFQRTFNKKFNHVEIENPDPLYFKSQIIAALNNDV